jgi:hypothetical protein
MYDVLIIIIIDLAISQIHDQKKLPVQIQDPLPGDKPASCSPKTVACIQARLASDAAAPDGPAHADSSAPPPERTNALAQQLLWHQASLLVQVCFKMQWRKIYFLNRCMEAQYVRRIY